MIAAAEAVVVDLLNATYPRAAHDAKDGTSGDTADNAAVGRGRTRCGREDDGRSRALLFPRPPASAARRPPFARA